MDDSVGGTRVPTPSAPPLATGLTGVEFDSGRSAFCDSGHDFRDALWHTRARDPAFRGAHVLDSIKRGPPHRDLRQHAEAAPDRNHTLGAKGPCVINLVVSNAPFKMPAKPLPTLGHLQIYQLQRVEYGRLRFRLRLGPIMSELEADVHLAAVRQLYPYASTVTAGKDDQCAIETAAAALARNGIESPGLSGPGDNWPRQKVQPRHSDGRDATHESINDFVDPQDAYCKTIPQFGAVAFSPSHAQRAGATPVSEITEARQLSRPTSMVSNPLGGNSGSFMKHSRRLSEVNPEPLAAMDSTQTFRALSVSELGEHSLSKWFVIQLAVADRAFRPEDVLNLAIFNEFNLYSTVHLKSGGGRQHALRLGFFLEKSAALTVASYVQGYFHSAVVQRVSADERERFAERRVVARKHSDATGIHETIELSTPPSAPATTRSHLPNEACKRENADRSLKLGIPQARKR